MRGHGVKKQCVRGHLGDGGMRGHGVKEQCVRGHFKEMATRARPYVTTATLGLM
jgi:hypothetical protein